MQNKVKCLWFKLSQGIYYSKVYKIETAFPPDPPYDTLIEFFVMIAICILIRPN